MILTSAPVSTRVFTQETGVRPYALHSGETAIWRSGQVKAGGRPRGGKLYPRQEPQESRPILSTELMLWEVRGRKGQPSSSHPRGPLLDAGEAAPPDACVQGGYLGAARAKALITHGEERTGQRNGREGGEGRGGNKGRGHWCSCRLKEDKGRGERV